MDVCGEQVEGWGFGFAGSYQEGLIQGWCGLASVVEGLDSGLFCLGSGHWLVVLVDALFMRALHTLVQLLFSALHTFFSVVGFGHEFHRRPCPIHRA